MDIDQQISFCEKQIANLTKLYIHLVNLKSGKPGKFEKTVKPKLTEDEPKIKTKKSKSKKSKKAPEPKDSEDEVEDVLNFIDEIAGDKDEDDADDFEMPSLTVPQKRMTKEEEEQVTTYEPVVNGNGVTLDDLENDTDYEKLLAVRKDRKAVSDEFEARRIKIVAEEKQLIASGVNENDAREIMRRKYYPGSIAKVVMSAEDMRIERLKLKEQGYDEAQAEEKLKLMYPDYAFNKIADAEQSDDDPDDIVDEIVLARDN